MKLQNYINGNWITGDGDGQILKDAVTGEAIATATTKGLDFKSMLHYGRTVGNTALRKLSFHERGRMLKALAMHLMNKKEKFYQVSYHSGATKADSWIDIEGGIGNLFANASLRRKFPDLPYCTDGDAIGLSKGGTFMGHHILVPKEGVAVHINAYNFPVWGMLEKCAVNWLAGVPAIVKPASITCYITEVVVKEIIASGNKTISHAFVELEKEMDTFFAVFQKNNQQQTRNPFFGDLNFEQNVQLLYKHALHHLRQFGLTVS
jgi:oxepin-CoA hydrolase/3-oxo-5,6-dehydrosuberyl-CoA semialdehyde dehydrogenase